MNFKSKNIVEIKVAGSRDNNPAVQGTVRSYHTQYFSVGSDIGKASGFKDFSGVKIAIIEQDGDRHVVLIPAHVNPTAQHEKAAKKRTGFILYGPYVNKAFNLPINNPVVIMEASVHDYEEGKCILLTNPTYSEGNKRGPNVKNTDGDIEGPTPVGVETPVAKPPVAKPPAVPIRKANK